MEDKFRRLADNLERMRPYLNQYLSCYNRDFMDVPLETQIDNQKITIKRIEIDIDRAEEQVLMILRDINMDKMRYDKSQDTMSEEGKEAHHYKISRAYLDIEKYQVDIRHHQRRLETNKERLNDLFLSLKRQSCA